jgi:hypothetical protein
VATLLRRRSGRWGDDVMVDSGRLMTTIKQCMGYFRPSASSPNVHPKAKANAWGRPVDIGGEERRKGMSDVNDGYLGVVLADDKPTAMTVLDKQKPTSVEEWTMQSSQ